MILRWRSAGAASKPPCGAVDKIQGAERTRKRHINVSGMDNGDEREWTTDEVLSLNYDFSVIIMIFMIVGK